MTTGQPVSVAGARVNVGNSSDEWQHALERRCPGCRRRRCCRLGGQTVPGTEAGYAAGVSPRPRTARELASMAPVIQSGIAVHT